MRRLRASAIFLILITTMALGQGSITTPKAQFGSAIGDDYFLVNYTQMIEYWQKLERESPRLRLVEIGKSSEGRTMTMAIVTSPENQERLSDYRNIVERLAKAEKLTESEARELASEGKAVIWIDGGLHSNETLGAQQIIETVYRLASATDSETERMLRDVIVLACIANPDGMELVSNWYMRERDPRNRSLANLPTLYQKYAGHDDNRDFYMAALPETQAINTVLYRNWFPQIVYDHHQTAPQGTVMFSPPFRDPYNFNLDPLVITTLEEVSGAMHSRFAAEGKPGVVSRSASNYSAWWNGGMRTSPYFHNMIGLLTETVGNPTPMEIPFVLNRQLRTSDEPIPVEPQTWHFRQSIEYSITANLAVIDYAARNKDRLLFNIYRMGRNSIERGSRDSWTVTPESIAAAQAGNAPRSLRALRRPEDRDARAFIVPSDQPDFLTAKKFINALLWNGIDVLESSSAFRVGDRTYPAGSFVVKTDQAFRPHVLDMFEPQHHPNDFAYPGGPPVPPYDSAGWTLAFQMGVRFDRILESVDGPFTPVAFPPQVSPGAITSVEKPAGYLFTHEANDSFRAVNRLLAAGDSVYWLSEDYTVGGENWPAGTHYVASGNGTQSRLETLAKEVGLSFQGVSSVPTVEALQLKPVRVALWDRYGGSSTSGWTRLVLEQFEFPYTLVYPQALDAGELKQQFDVLILVGDSTFQTGETRTPRNVPEEYSDRIGNLTTTATLPRLRDFLSDGGTILAMGDSTRVAQYWSLPLSDALKDLPSDQFYIPGSILRARIQRDTPLTFGLPDYVDLFYDQSPVFRLEGNLNREDAQALAWFDSDTPLRSGWALGQDYLQNAAAVVEMSVGEGKLILYGPDILFRSQPHGLFKLLFNGIYEGSTQELRLN